MDLDHCFDVYTKTEITLNRWLFMGERNLHVDEMMELISKNDIIGAIKSYNEGQIVNRSKTHFFTYEEHTYPSRSIAGFILKNKGNMQPFDVGTFHLLLKRYGIECWKTYDKNDPRLNEFYGEESQLSQEEEKKVEYFANKVQSEKKGTFKQLKEYNKELAKQPVKERIVMAKVLSRSRAFAQIVKEKAGYRCEICGCEGFQTPNGLYAEAHHTYELAKTKIDSPDVMICVCPTCHRIIHYGTPAALENRRLLKKN